MAESEQPPITRTMKLIENFLSYEKDCYQGENQMFINILAFIIPVFKYVIFLFIRYNCSIGYW